MGTTRKMLRQSTVYTVLMGICLPFSLATTAQEEGVKDIEEVVVTGSRIRNTFGDTPTPITVIDLAEIEGTGTTNFADVMSATPSNIAKTNRSSTSFTVNSPGLELAELRGLGNDRTLVLVNGRRYVSGVTAGVGYGVDLNSIPTSIIDRVEILTGGASAIYGSDAVAGVVNIITKQSFEGVEMNFQGGRSAEGDNGREDFDITIGGNFENGGNAWLNFGYSDAEGLKARDRSFSDEDTAWYDLDGDGRAEAAEWLGSSFPPQGRFGGYNGDGSVFRSGLADRANSDRFNRADFRTIVTPNTRRMASGGLNLPITDSVLAFAELNYTRVEASDQLEPFAMDINNDIFDINRVPVGDIDIATHPLIPTLLRDNLLGDGLTTLNELGANNTARRLVEFGPRASEIDRTTMRVSSGLDITLDNGWDANVFMLWGQTETSRISSGQINTARALAALNVEAAPGGGLQCADLAARQSGCVPFNVFGAGTISPEAVEYLAISTGVDGLIEQFSYGGSLAGDVGIELPGGSIGFAAGLEYREEKGRETPDGLTQQGITAGNRILPTGGSFDVTEAYLELNFPVLDALTLGAAARVGDYSTVGNQTTWRATFDADLGFAIPDLRFRGSVSESVRAPNIADLFAGDGETFRTVQDPCDGVTAATLGNVADNCRSIPEVAARIASTGSFSLTQVERQSTGGFIGGNPDVQEETADSFTLGFVYTPSYLPGFSVAIDAFDFNVKDAIAVTTRSTVLERCFDAVGASFDSSCNSQARRNPTTGALFEVDSGTSNENELDIEGFDVTVSYAMQLNDVASFLAGSLDLSLNWVQLTKDETTGADGVTRSDLEEIESPRDRFVSTANYQLDDLQVYLRLRYWGSVSDSNTPLLTNDNSGVFGNPLASSVNRIESKYYTDLQARYLFSDKLKATVGINNLTDEEPGLLPQISNYGDTGSNTNAAAYDPYGRSYYMGLNYSF